MVASSQNGAATSECPWLVTLLVLALFLPINGERLTPGGKPLLVCDQPKIDSVLNTYSKARAALDLKSYADASGLSQAGLKVLGDDYDPYYETTDNGGGMHLLAADLSDRDGHPDRAAWGRTWVLHLRIELYLMNHQCRTAKIPPPP